MTHIKRIDEMSSNANASKKYYVYRGHYEMYISDVPMYSAPSNYPYRTFSTFEKAFEYASKKEVDILYSEGLKDEVCDFYGDSDYYNDNTEFFFNPEEPLSEGFSLNNRRENEDDKLRDTFCGLDISDAKKKLGYWWTLDTQDVNGRTGVGSYVFVRKGHGAIKFTTENNIIVDVEDLGY